jgi:hypothetical protein
VRTSHVLAKGSTTDLQLHSYIGSIIITSIWLGTVVKAEIGRQKSKASPKAKTRPYLKTKAKSGRAWLKG